MTQNNSGSPSNEETSNTVVAPSVHTDESFGTASAALLPDGGTSASTNEDLDQAGRAELLAEENRRLRAEYQRAQQSKYRRTAVGLVAVGCLAAIGGVVFPNGRDVLFALAATGLFGGILTLYLTPGRFVTADVGERVYAAMAANETALTEELGLSEQRVYVPADGRSGHLYIPQQSEFEIPEDSDRVIIADEDTRGLLLDATGASLFEEFDQALSGELADDLSLLATQLADGIVEQFELASAVDADVDTENGRVTFRVSQCTFGDLNRLDHPITSFLAVGITISLQQPVSVDVTPGDERADWLVTCRWDAENE
jgi:hypothetical protein